MSEEEFDIDEVELESEEPASLDDEDDSWE